MVNGIIDEVINGTDDGTELDVETRPDLVNTELVQEWYKKILNRKRRRNLATKKKVTPSQRKRTRKLVKLAKRNNRK